MKILPSLLCICSAFNLVLMESKFGNTGDYKYLLIKLMGGGSKLSGLGQNTNQAPSKNSIDQSIPKVGKGSLKSDIDQSISKVGKGYSKSRSLSDVEKRSSKVDESYSSGGKTFSKQESTYSVGPTKTKTNKIKGTKLGSPSVDQGFSNQGYRSTKTKRMSKGKNKFSNAKKQENEEEPENETEGESTDDETEGESTDDESEESNVTKKPAGKKAYSKVLVAGHDPQVEIIDLSSSETTCQDLDEFPFAVDDAAAELVFDENPIICGGQPDHLSACQIYENDAWVETDPLIKGRYEHAMIQSPFKDGSRLFITGGYSGLSTSEVLTDNGWEKSVALPVKIAEHCMLKLNESSIIMIAGRQNSRVSKNTFIFNAETKLWIEGPKLILARSDHCCGVVRKSSNKKVKSLIAVGGYRGSSRHSSVEILDLGADAWRKGPSFPFGISDADMVDDPDGGVVLIGGFDGTKTLDSVYKLPHGGLDATWEEMPQKLKVPRKRHTAFLVPDEITECL